VLEQFPGAPNQLRGIIAPNIEGAMYEPRLVVRSSEPQDPAPAPGSVFGYNASAPRKEVAVSFHHGADLLPAFF
jgi:hypothetical protein